MKKIAFLLLGFVFNNGLYGMMEEEKQIQIKLENMSLFKDPKKQQHTVLSFCTGVCDHVSIGMPSSSTCRYLKEKISKDYTDSKGAPFTIGKLVLYFGGKKLKDKDMLSDYKSGPNTTTNSYDFFILHIK